MEQRSSSIGLKVAYSAAIFWNAFLLFQVQLLSANSSYRGSVAVPLSGRLACSSFRSCCSPDTPDDALFDSSTAGISARFAVDRGINDAADHAGLLVETDERRLARIENYLDVDGKHGAAVFYAVVDRTIGAELVLPDARGSIALPPVLPVKGWFLAGIAVISIHCRTFVFDGDAVASVVLDVCRICSALLCSGCAVATWVRAPAEAASKWGTILINSEQVQPTGTLIWL